MSKVSRLIGTVVQKMNQGLKDDPKEKELKKWHEQKGDLIHRLEYELTEDSVVFDLGGYVGQWTSDIFSKHQCNIYIFEPVTEYYDIIRKRFSRNKKIKAFNFGLSNKNEKTEIFIHESSSSKFVKGEKSQYMELRRFDEFLRSEKLDKIDLMKINIEGGEYDLLDHILDKGLIGQIVDLQVQFHDFVENASKRRQKIQKRLGKTHALTYCFNFIWENWRLKDRPVRGKG